MNEILDSLYFSSRYNVSIITFPFAAAFFLDPLGLPRPLFATGACSSSDDLADSLVLVGAGGLPLFLESPLAS